MIRFLTPIRSSATSILLLFCLVAPLATTLSVVSFQKMQIRKAVKQRMIAGIDKKDLVLLKLTRDEARSRLRWEHDAEFEYNGQMYDIVTIEVGKDTLFYWCWWDNEETQLNKQLDALTACAAGDDFGIKDQQNRLIQFFQSLFFEPAPILPVLAWQPTLPVATRHSAFVPLRFPPPIPPPEIV